MKISKYIFIYTISLCLAVHGIAFAQICIGSDHSDSNIDWTSHCHAQKEASHHSGGSHETSFGHVVNDCIDISISSTGNLSSNNNNDDQLNSAKPIILKSTSSDHPFFSFDFSKLKTNLFPDFTDMTPQSIASTILIV